MTLHHSPRAGPDDSRVPSARLSPRAALLQASPSFDVITGAVLSRGSVPAAEVISESRARSREGRRRKMVIQEPSEPAQPRRRSSRPPTQGQMDPKARRRLLTAPQTGAASHGTFSTTLINNRTRVHAAKAKTEPLPVV